MRKKLAMRRNTKVAKYQAGGSVRGQRPTEDRAAMARDAAPGFDAEEEAVLARRAARAAAVQERQRANQVAREAWRAGASAIANRPVGAAPNIPMPQPQAAPQAVAATMDLPTPPEFVPPPTPAARAARGRPATPARGRSRRREMSADELNDREMTRILNERSLEASRAGRNMYRKGGKVKCK